ncbi:MAG: exo-alpha-sialidase [Phycisphaeraceae bacterium]|nr:exo-alpha-sialidase [Phycisphaeraceae bacterium]
MIRQFACVLLILPVLNSTAQQITVTEHVVFDGHAGWQHDGITYRLAVGVITAQAANGDLVLAWTTGSDKEPADDNCGVISRSSDGGKTWTEPVVLVPAQDGMQGVITNLYRTKDGKLVLYGAHLPPQDRYTTWYYCRMISDDNGQTWSPPPPEEFVLRDGHGSLGQGEIPIDLPDGRSLYVGHWYKKRPQPLIAPAAQLAHAQSLAEAEAMPAGEGRTAGAFADFFQGIQAYAAPDDHSTTFQPLGSIFDRPLGLIEPTTIRLRDGTLVVLMRADWGGFLWRSESTDDGQTWSKAYQTDIPNPSSMVDLVRLADGRIALILNPSGGVVGERARRDPLAIWISDDEMKTWSVKQDLIHGGQLAYPDSIVLDDGRLVFGYDRDRRQVRFVEVHFNGE